MWSFFFSICFFFNDTATTEIYTLSLHDALPILLGISDGGSMAALFAATYPERTSQLVLWGAFACSVWAPDYPWRDRKSTRLNSSHANISYAVFCLKKKKKN